MEEHSLRDKVEGGWDGGIEAKKIWIRDLKKMPIWAPLNLCLYWTGGLRPIRYSKAGGR